MILQFYTKKYNTVTSGNNKSTIDNTHLSSIILGGTNKYRYKYIDFNNYNSIINYFAY